MISGPATRPARPVPDSASRTSTFDSSFAAWGTYGSGLAQESATRNCLLADRANLRTGQRAGTRDLRVLRIARRPGDFDALSTEPFSAEEGSHDSHPQQCRHHARGPAPAGRGVRGGGF